MPVLIPVVVAYAATSVAVTAGLFAAGTLAASVFFATVSIAASAIVSAATAPSGDNPGASLGAGGASRSQQIRSPVAPHEVVVGRIRKSGVIAFLHSQADDDGRADGFFYAVYILASHHCRMIGDTFLDGVLSSDPKFANLVRIDSAPGDTDQPANADFVAETGGAWGATDRWRGRALLYTLYKGSATAFPAGVPNPQVMVWGVDDILDPRLGSSGWGNNPILIVYWFMRRHEGYDADEFDQAQIIAAANVCDERVRVTGGTTVFTADAATDYCVLTASARELDVGDGVRVATSATLPGGLAANTTYYVYPGANGNIKLCTSVANAFAGVGVNLTDAGSGTHTIIYWDEARYKCNGMFSLDAEKVDIRNQLLTSCAGYAAEIGGVWFLFAGADAVPTVTLNEDDLRGNMITTTRRSLRDRINGARAVFVNADNNWQPSDARPFQVAEYVEQDNGAELFQDLRFPFTLSARCVQRLQKLHVRRNRRQMTVQYPAKLSGMQLRLLDGVYIDNDRYGWVQKRFVVIGWALAEDFGIDLVLQDDDGLTYEWDVSEERDFSQPGALSLPAPATIAAPASITLTTPPLLYSSVTVSWAPVSSIWFDGYDLEYKASAAVDWIPYGRSTPAAQILMVGAAVDVRVRAVTRNGATSDFVTDTAPGIPTAFSATASGSTAVDLAWTNGSGTAAVQIWHTMVDGVLTEATLLDTVVGTSYAHVGLGEGEAHFYWLRALNATGNVSNVTDLASVAL